MRSRIKFGTDGWRGIIADDFTFDNVRLCGRAVAAYLHELGLAGRGLVVGYDTRFASEEFAEALAETVAEGGVPAFLCDRAAPTPAISYAILSHQAAGAVIITASHNPGRYNGLKFKPEYASSAPQEVTDAIERHLHRLATGQPPDGNRERQPIHPFNPQDGYLRQLGSLVEVERLRLAALRVVADPMYGAGSGYFPLLLGGGGGEVLEIHGERNPLFPGLHGPEPTGDNLGDLARAVVEHRAAIGLANDGDADRMGVVDERGEYINPQVVYALLLYYLLEIRGQRGAIVRTAGGTVMADKLAARYGLPVHETPVGFKYVAAKIMETEALFGGEESSGYAFHGHIPERDGILAGLCFLDLMVQSGKTPSALVEQLHALVGVHYHDRVDLPCSAEQRRAALARLEAERPERIAGLRVLKARPLQGFKFDLEGGSWLMLRFSGTEPLLRIYAETPQPGKVAELLAEGQRLAGL
jgi:phosphomannomutase